MLYRCVCIIYTYSWKNNILTWYLLPGELKISCCFSRSNYAIVLQISRNVEWNICSKHYFEIHVYGWNSRCYPCFIKTSWFFYFFLNSKSRKVNDKILGFPVCVVTVTTMRNNVQFDEHVLCIYKMLFIFNAIISKNR